MTANDAHVPFRAVGRCLAVIGENHGYTRLGGLQAYLEVSDEQVAGRMRATTRVFLVAIGYALLCYLCATLPLHWGQFFLDITGHLLTP